MPSVLLALSRRPSLRGQVAGHTAQLVSGTKIDLLKIQEAGYHAYFLLVIVERENLVGHGLGLRSSCLPSPRTGIDWYQETNKLYFGPELRRREFL